MINAVNARAFRDEAIAAMRDVFGSRLLVWDVYAIGEGLPPHVLLNRTDNCYNTHVPSEIVDVENQVLLWQLSRLATT